MKTPVIALFAVLAISFGACGLVSHYVRYNFEKDRVTVAYVGAEMLNTTEIYQDDVYGTVLQRSETTLTYSGKQGKVIKIFYCEASDNSGRPSFSQELTYDIANDPIITFKDTKIKVLEATNSLIKFVVLDAKAYKYKNGAKIE